MATKRFRTISVYSNGDPSIGDPGHFIKVDFGEEIEWSDERKDWGVQTQWMRELKAVFGAMFDDQFFVRFDFLEPGDLADNDTNRL